jgi:hypothetical protein
MILSRCHGCDAVMRNAQQRFASSRPLTIVLNDSVPLLEASSILSRASVKLSGPASFKLSDFDQIPFCLVG